MHKILFVFLAGVSLSASAATFYVSPTGDNGNSGTRASPWRTLQFAADTMAAGDTAIVTPGTYAGFNLTKSGLAGRPTVFSAQPGAIIDRAGSSSGAFVDLQAASHVVIEGFAVTGAPQYGIRAIGVDERRLATDVVIRRNTVANSGISNILTGFVGNVRVEDNVVHGAIAADGIYVSNSADNPVIRNNVVYRNRGGGIRLNGDVHSGGDGIISNALIENNRIHGNGAGGSSGIDLDGVQSSVIQNNLLYHNHASGISLYQIDGGRGSRNNLVANNTVINAPDGRWALNIRDASSGNTVLNNILFSLQDSRGAIDIDPDSLIDFVSDHNLLESVMTIDDSTSVIDIAAWRNETGGDSHSTPLTMAQMMGLFRNFDAQDFQLAALSLAIDAGGASLLNGGTKNAPLYDHLMAIRPAGAGFDIGAFEIQPVPEPGTWMMLLIGCALVLGVHSRRRSLLR